MDTNHMHTILCVQNHKRTSYNVLQDRRREPGGGEAKGWRRPGRRGGDGDGGTGDKKRRGEGKLGALCHHADAIGEWNLAFGGSGGAPPTKPSY